MKRNKTLTIAIPLAIVLFLIAAEYGYSKIQSKMASIKERQAGKTQLVEKYISLISEKPALAKNFASLKEERSALNLKLIEGSTPSIAAAALQEKIKGIVTEKGGTISSERIEKTEELEIFTIISVSINAALPDSGALNNILYAIEAHTPRLVVKELDVTVKNHRNPTGDITINLVVSAITNKK
ncbi:MAG: type II secretion system protein GspM [Nitrospirota bacterium]